jgi:dihydrolipoamide dehydrogenase
MSESFDVVILGAGPGGEVALNTLVKHGKHVALVEREVIGGECTNWGCIPSKTLLRPTELRGKAMRAAGIHTPMLDFEDLATYRDYMVSNHDDSERIARYEARGVRVFKAPGRIAGRGRVDVGGEALECDAIVVATGAEAVVPPIPGLAEAGFWTNREATDITEVPGKRRGRRGRPGRARDLAVPRPLRVARDRGPGRRPPGAAGRAAHRRAAG